MINSVSTLMSNPVAVSRDMPVSVPDPSSMMGAGRPDFDYTMSHIRVDIDADIAILEFRSVETGDVLRQYPTEKQIAGYQRAAELEANKASRAETMAQMTTGSSPAASSPAASSTGQTVARTDTAPAPEAQAIAAPAPAANPAAGPVSVTAGMAQLSDTSSVSARVS